MSGARKAVSERERQKRVAAERAVMYVESGMRLGLGTGSTAKHVLDVLGEKLRDGTLRDIAGVPTSRATAEYARTVGIPLLDLDDVQRLDLAIDGADEVDPRLDLIKGLGGALLWEKIVESAADRFVVVVDESKLVRRLGEKAPVPVEVVPFGWRSLLPHFIDAGARPELRMAGAEPLMTDGGHHIVDCHFDGGIEDAAATAQRLRARAGVVETGMFIGMATSVVVAGAEVVVMQSDRSETTGEDT
ncbi:MAG: ribose-5-phosphate isomerase RpiA [Gemmatimonadetes bacterium]|nr:ribose-5-phosphate isomerase RpiA [Gemmatimonadota bacterium]